MKIDKRLDAYTTSVSGGVNINIELIFIDLVTVLKAGGCPKEAFLRMANEIWDQTEVSVAIPKEIKN